MLPSFSDAMSTTFNKWVHQLDKSILSHEFKEWFEKIILSLAIVGFIIHIIYIGLVDFGLYDIPSVAGDLFISPIAAIYTPFSFILISEVYLLIYYIPSSFTTSVLKEYQIISLIVIRRIFKDIASVENTKNWFSVIENRALMIDMIGFILLFALIFLFRYLSQKQPKKEVINNFDRFLRTKKSISILLFFTFVVLIFYSLVQWIIEARQFSLGSIEKLSDINYVFYNEFFTILILVDVLILLISLFYIDDYSRLIRNSGFIISTILIRLSFSAPSELTTPLVLAGVSFGVLVLMIYNYMGKMSDDVDNVED